MLMKTSTVKHQRVYQCTQLILAQVLKKDTGLSLDAGSIQVKRPRRGAVPWHSPSPAYTKERQTHSHMVPTDNTKLTEK